MQKYRALGWVSISPDHEVTPKNRATIYILYYYCFCSVDKNHHLHRRWINPFPHFLASHDLKTNLVLIKFNSRHSRKLKICIKQFKFQFRDPSGFWNLEKKGSYFFSEDWTRRPNTLPCSRELLSNNCSGKIVTTRGGF